VPNRDQGADSHPQTTPPSDNYLDDLPLLMRRGEQRQVSQFRQHASQFRLKITSGQDEEGRKRPQQYCKPLTSAKGPNTKATSTTRIRDHRRAPGPANVAEGMVDNHRQDDYLQNRPPNAFE
jgi:hypothetical protein